MLSGLLCGSEYRDIWRCRCVLWRLRSKMLFQLYQKKHNKCDEYRDAKRPQKTEQLFHCPSRPRLGGLPTELFAKGSVEHTLFNPWDVPSTLKSLPDCPAVLARSAARCSVQRDHMSNSDVQADIPSSYGIPLESASCVHHNAQPCLRDGCQGERNKDIAGNDCGSSVHLVLLQNRSAHTQTIRFDV